MRGMPILAAATIGQCHLAFSHSKFCIFVGQPILAAAAFSGGFSAVACPKEPAEKPAAARIGCPTIFADSASEKTKWHWAILPAAGFQPQPDRLPHRCA